MASYFCTTGRGTEPFAKEEIQSLVDVEMISHQDGKVFWKCPITTENLKRLKCLRSVERLFICVLHQEKPDMDESYLGRKGLQNLLTTLGNQLHQWKNSLHLWFLFQSTHKEYATFHGAIKKRKVSSENNQASFDAEEHEQTDIIKSDSSSEKESKSTTTSCIGKRKIDCIAEPFSNSLPVPDSEVTFRVSLKCSGKARSFQTSGISGRIGALLSEKLGWKVNLKSPLIEVYIQVNDAGLVVGLPVTRMPLSSRPYLKHIGLRSTVAWIMASQAHIQPGDVVMDPMCGCSTILIEAAKSWTSSFYIGCDNTESQLKKASENIQNMDNNNICLIQSDVKALPFQDGSVNVILCDTPFGVNHGSIKEIIKTMPSMLSSLNRVLCVGGRVVLLTGYDLKDKLLKQVEGINNETNAAPKNFGLCLQSNCQSSVKCEQTLSKPKSAIYDDDTAPVTSWKAKGIHYLKLGETHAYMCAFRKEMVPIST